MIDKMYNKPKQGSDKMGKLKAVIMSLEHDDMGSPTDTIKELQIINDLMEGNGYGTVDYPEGFGGDCSE